MKSPMVENAGYIKPEEKSGYSELQVMHSNAGWYVGTSFYDPEIGCDVPGSRDSGYYRTEAEAEKALKLMVTFNAGTRDTP